ncbi:sensor histidine kinase [Paenibacillus psychroresistens]|uniref:sensor histidine kinase n=1 Tax=Paenibacillus psychroresistens TaxID=1778678 RepID=UPI001D04119D|nr:sensor histidine kinase [Paenibacillus psychroresistens]
MSKKLIIFFIFLIVLPILLVDWFVSVKVANLTEDQIGNTILQLAKTSHLTLDHIITSVDSSAEKLMVTQEAQQMFDDSNLSAYDRLQKFLALDKLTTTYSTNSLNFSIFIPALSESYPFAPTSDVQDTGVFYSADSANMDWFLDAVKAKGSGIIRTINQLGNNPMHIKTSGYIRKMSNTLGGNSNIGVLVVSGLDVLLQKELTPLNLPKDGVIIFMNNNNVILSNTSNLEIGSTLTLPPKLKSSHDGVYKEDEDGHPWLYAFHTSPSSATKILFKIPVNSIIGEHVAVRELVNYLMLAYFLILIVISIYFSRYILSPLSKLARLTRSFEPGRSIAVELQLDRKDEIGLLNNAFIEMTKRLNQTINDKYVLEIKQKEAELSLLHTQINPHLLYNTLESIYWRTMIEGKSESAEMIHDLSLLMRIGLSRGKILIPISEELKHLEAYIRLQSKRYDYSFALNWDIDEETKLFLIPKVVLQPLVENAIIHGIRNMEQDGELWISIKMLANKICIKIEDNGYKSTDISRLNLVLEGVVPYEGFGIKNVNKRIQLHFGTNYGLSYEIRDGGGVRAIINIPPILEEIQ